MAVVVSRGNMCSVTSALYDGRLFNGRGYGQRFYWQSAEVEVPGAPYRRRLVLVEAWNRLAILSSDELDL